MDRPRVTFTPATDLTRAREGPSEPVLAGASSALLDVSAYCGAALIGVCLGAWSAGWDRYGAEACLHELIVYGLRRRPSFLCFFGLGMLTLIYYKLDVARWELLNGLALLWTIFTYVAMGAGNIAEPIGVWLHRPSPVPGWRIIASVAAIVVVYVAGRVASFLGWPWGRRPR